VPLVALSLCFGYFLFGWAGFFWVGAIRLVYCLHMQCFVNSLLHLKPGLPEGMDSSQNIWWLGPLQVTAWGENWHGNHHGKPASACFSRHWWQIDIGWYVIRSLEAVGLATNVRR
jgi:stearoyl-CoA desaturase (delta-9 desaturase)